MQIQLKQAEIVAALEQYVSKQGISLTGKSVDIKFTSGRKDNGLSADIVIEDLVIPGTEVGETEVVKPTLVVVTSLPQEADPAPVQQEAPGTAPKETVSLFGG